MKKFLLLFFLSAQMFRQASGQATESYGKPIAEIFTDFHVNFNDTAKHTGFDLNRGYFGYHFMPGGNLTGKLIVNVGSPEDLIDGSVPRRYAYFREASLIWSDERLTVSFGITGTKIFEYQQKFWGKRYVANTYQSINGYGFIADLGIVIDYHFNDIFKIDFTLMNGEGYSNIQLDNGLRTSAGLTITPESGLAFRIYFDLERVNTVWQPMFVGFAGFKNDKITIGAEVTYKSNLDLTEGHDAWGFSGTGSVNLTGKTELFARYDHSKSATVPGETQQWNYLNDGDFLVIGIQYSFNKYVKIALDYQGTYPYDTDSQKSEEIILNALFKF
jgi:hypothetical protein